MTYATQAELETRFSHIELLKLTDRTNSGAVDVAVVTRALADADAEIDGYLAARYTLPLTPIPPVLSRVAADIARYHLYGDRVQEAVRQRYEDAIRLLKSIAKGEVQLGIATGALPDVAGSSGMVRSKPAMFSADTLAKY